MLRLPAVGRAFALAILVTAFGAASPAFAQSAGQKPAVDGINGKASFQGGRLDGDDTYFGAGSISLPVTHETGIQIDGAAGRIAGETAFAFGGHAFWRDPDRFLLGGRIAYGRITGKNFNVLRISADTELYFGNWTVEARAGFQALDLEHGAFGQARLAWYPMPDLRLAGGFQLAAGDSTNLVLASAEYQLPFAGLNGLAVFVDGAFGQDSYSHLIAGVRYYLNPGKTKTLIRRHREDDPGNIGIETFGAGAGGVNDNGAPPTTTTLTCTPPAMLVGGVCVVPVP